MKIGRFLGTEDEAADEHAFQSEGKIPSSFPSRKLVALNLCEVKRILTK